MHTMRTAAALVASAAFVAAAPADIAERSTFHIEQVQKGQVLKSGPLQMMKTYGKYAKVGAVAPSDVQVAAAAVQSGSVSASPESYDRSYLCPVNVGGTTMMLDFDTGSADLWVFSNQLPSNEQTGHALYKETGTKKSGYTWDISYGDGSGASGNVYADKVVVGSVTATSQAVEAATSISTQFVQDTDNDGLLGLAFSSINTVEPVQQTTFFDTVKSTLAKALFTVTLKKGAPGTYTFGYIDSSKYTGGITYVPVDTSNGFWQFTASGVSGASIADTGTSLLYLPDSNVDAYYSKVSGAKYSSTYGGYVFSCSASLPNYSVVIGGTTFTVPGSYINYAPANNAGTVCFGGIQSSSGIGFNIFGDVFLKAVMVVFDVSTGSPRLGFAKQS